MSRDQAMTVTLNPAGIHYLAPKQTLSILLPQYMAYPCKWECLDAFRFVG